MIKPNVFDLIISVSALEHVKSEAIFDSAIRKMTKGTKNSGINCLIVNSEIQEINLETNSKLDAQMELNLSTESMLNKLNTNYVGWNVMKILVKPLEYHIIRNGKPILLKTNAITYVVRKNS